jgi:drug/metabolite transporter (DMT)-like permease
METWVAVTFAAAVFQTARFMLQKHLAGAALSVSGATFARFVYSAPLVAGLLIWTLRDSGLPMLGTGFWPNVVLGAVAQVVATLCVVATFSLRNFAVGITLMKTEVVLTVPVGIILLGEGVSGWAMAAILIGLGGVLALTDMPGADGPWRKRLWNRAAGLGLASGAIFAVSSVTYRAASLQVDSDQAFIRALVTLAGVVAVQVTGMGAWLIWRDRDQLMRVFRAWRVAGWVGVMSMAGSLCWFTAFTLQNAALVKAVGQVELLLSVIAGAVVFGERLSRREMIGMALVSASVLTLVLFP